MRIRRLGWAGIELEADGGTAVIDLFEDASPMAPWIGEPHEPLPPPSSRGTASLALVTHLHSDHADPAALTRALAPGAEVLRPAPSDGGELEAIGTAVAERGFAEHGLSTRVVEPWETVYAGPFTATAVPAADGLGDPQVSWVVEADGTRVIHCGDTVFHGWWWPIRLRTGTLDVAFLPVNGPRVDLPHRQPPSRLPAAMDPDQAAEAAAILGAGLAVPIHYDALERAPAYVQVDRPAETFVTAAESRGVGAHVLAPGQSLDALSASSRPA